MAYLGRGLDRGNYLKLDDIQSQFDGSKVTFNLTSGGQAFYPGSSYSILVSLAGIIQEPESAYSITNNTITFASAPAAVDDFFCIALGVPIGIGVPGRGSVNTDTIQNQSITAEKLHPDALAGAAGTWGSSNVGVHTSKLVGINTTTIVGTASSEGALQVNGNIAIVEGALLTNKNIEGEIYIPNTKNALLIGPVTVGAAATIDVAVGSVLVIV